MDFWKKIGKIFGREQPETTLCQKIPLKKSQEGTCEYVDPKSVRALRLKTALSNFFEQIVGGTPLSHDPIKRYVHVATKGSVTHLPEEIQKRYGKAQDPDESHRLRLQDVESFRREIRQGKSVDDAEGLKCILKNRQIIMDLNHILYEMRDLEQGIKWIQKAIQNLSEEHPKRVIQLKDGSRTFCIPGGNRKNPVCYEFRHNKEGEYFFIIHNRCSDQKVNKLLLDIRETCFEYNGKGYGKTSICIKLKPKGDDEPCKVADETFLMALFRAERSGNTEVAYKIIYDHLLAGEHAGSIVVSEEENEFKKCLKKIEKLEQNEIPDELINEMESLKEKIVNGDPSYNGLEIFESSAESNFTPPERVMVSSKTRHQLRQHTIRKIVEQIKEETFLHQKAEDAALILHLHNQAKNSE